MLPAACIIPESSARPGWVFPLVALFSPLVYLCPVPDTMPQDARLAGLVQAGRLLSLCPPMPVPAADKLRHLARSLAGSGAAQHGEQLKQLILESLASASNQEDTPALRQQLRSGAQASTAPAPSEDTLWQERLLLLLADQAEREQEELAAAMHRISRQHQELLASLGDEALDDLLPPEPVSTLETWQPKRLQAWARLQAQTAMPRQDLWYITRQEGLAAQIVEQHQLSAQRQQVYRLPELFLPALPAEAKPVFPAPLVQDCPGLLEAFAELESLAGNGADEDAVHKAAGRLAEEIPVWNAKVRAANASEASLCRLQLSILPGASFPQLLKASLNAASAQAEEPAPREAAGESLCLFSLLLDGAQEVNIRL